MVLLLVIAIGAHNVITVCSRKIVLKLMLPYAVAASIVLT